MTDQPLLPRITQLLSQRVDQSEPMIGLPQHQETGVRRQAIVTTLDLDRTIESRFKERPLTYTHWMNIRARRGEPIHTVNSG